MDVPSSKSKGKDDSKSLHNDLKISLYIRIMGYELPM